jgi:hypothetical protein
MTKRIGIRELTRNSSILDEADYIEIEDKKTKKLKGAFISEKYLDDVKEMLEKKEKEQKQKRLDFILKYAGSIKIEDRFKDKSYKEIREMIAKEKYGQ